MKDECLICGAPLKYLENDDLMECVVCHKKESSKTVCENGHYICNECHTQGMDSICSSDLHIKHGSVPRAVEGITVGHEMVGIVEEVGSAATHVKPGDRVTVAVEC